MRFNDTTTGLDFERAAAAHFGLTAFRVHRGMTVNTDTHGNASLALTIALTADDLASIAAHMSGQGNATLEDALSSFLGKPVAKVAPVQAPLSVGDKVVLRSGGPAMTVAGIGNSGDLTCSWGVESALHLAAFPPECLIRIAARTNVVHAVCTACHSAGGQVYA